MTESGNTWQFALLYYRPTRMIYYSCTELRLDVKETNPIRQSYNVVAIVGSRSPIHPPRHYVIPSSPKMFSVPVWFSASEVI